MNIQATKKQSGAVLAVALILLILVTLLGISGIRTTSLEEKMSANSYDRNIAFQSAEAALRQAEKYVLDNNVISSYTDTDLNACPALADSINKCDANGVCATPDVNCPPRWNNSAFTGWKKAEAGLDLQTSGDDPQYFIEYLGGNFICDNGSFACKRYRITAQSNPRADRSTVMLQSIFAK